MLTAEQIQERNKYIGGSDCAAVLGLSRWSSPLEVWALKTGQIEPKDLSDNLAVELGNELEDTVARLFSKRTGKKVHRVNETIFHPKYPFLGANIDRRVVGEDSVLEVKTASGWKAREWAGEDIPQEYQLQAHHYLAVSGKQRCYLACLIGGNQEFHIKTIERDEKLLADIVAKEVAFWRTFVELKVMPTLITKNDSDALFSLFPASDPTKEISLDDNAIAMIESLQALRADAANLKGQIERTENEVKAFLKDAEIGTSDKWRVTWKTQTGKRLDMDAFKEQRPEVYIEFAKPSTTRVLRVTEIKEKKNGNK